MVGRGAKGGEGMGRAAAADVLGGWEGMVPASPDHARYPRPPRPPRPCPPRRTLFTPQQAGGGIPLWYIANPRPEQESRTVGVCLSVALGPLDASRANFARKRLRLGLRG